jgi:hypothetical protein
MALISFKYNFIFIKTTKTAGTSLEVDLSPLLEDEAIVTPIGSAPAGHMPRNFATPKGNYFNHIGASEIRSMLGPAIYEGMFKFCVEREPLDKCISHFHMLRNSPEHNRDGTYGKDWRGYCRARDFPVDLEKYSEIRSGKRVSLVDRILRYETLAADLPALLDRLGIRNFTLASREKSAYSARRLVSREDVAPPERRIIDRGFADTRALTGLYPALEPGRTRWFGRD